MHHESITGSSSILAAAVTRWIGPALLITAEQQRAALLAQDGVEGTHYGLIDYESVQSELLSGLRQEHFKGIACVGASQTKVPARLPHPPRPGCKPRTFAVTTR